MPLVGKHITGVVESGNYAAGNASSLLESVNTVTKGGAFAYGITMTGASAIDAFQAQNMAARCLFGVGCVCGATGTVVNGFSFFNNTVGLSPIGVMGISASGACYWLGHKANAIGRRIDVPGV